MPDKNNKLMEDIDESEDLLELQPGKTAIGTLRGNFKDRIETFTIYYGNVASPVINGEVLHLPDERYMEMLKEFLETDEGLKYRVPTGDEVEAAINSLLTKERKVVQNKAKEEKKKADEEKKIEEEAMRQELEAERIRLEEENRRLEQERKKAEQEKFEAERKAIEEENRRLEEQAKAEQTLRLQKQDTTPATKEKKTKPNGKYKWALGLTLGLLLLSLAANAFMFMRYYPNNSKTLGQLNIDGQVYEIPLASVDVNSGETKIIIYGISTTNRNGQITNKAIPLGEFYLDGTKIVGQ